MQLIVICVLAIFALASAFAPRAALARVANKRSTLQLHPIDFISSTAPLIAQASDPVWGASAPVGDGNPIFAFVLIAGAIMGSLPGFLRAFEKPNTPVKKGK